MEVGALAALQGPLGDKLSSEKWSHEGSTVAARDVTPCGGKKKITPGVSLSSVSCQVLQLARNQQSRELEIQ